MKQMYIDTAWGSRSSGGQGRAKPLRLPYSTSVVQCPALRRLLLCRGITNGINTKEWDPETDEQLPMRARYSSRCVGQGKAAAKAHLQQQLGLLPSPHTPLLAFLGRLSPQKGADVVLAALPLLLAPPQSTGANVPGGACQIALLGAGWHSASFVCHGCFHVRGCHDSA